MIHHALIVEDLPEARRWLAAALNLAFPKATIDVAEDCSAARRRILERAPDIALIDLGLPDGSGIDLIAALKAAHPECLAVVASTFTDDAHVFPALRAGADGYLTKDGEPERLAETLTRIQQGDPPISPAIARRMLSFFQPVEPDVQPLTPRERDVLQLIGKGYTNAEVAGLLTISPNTAAGYVKDIYRKLGIRSRAEAATKAVELGLLSH
jgi:DNA-binding NarL/FixJ family response regulator